MSRQSADQKSPLSPDHAALLEQLTSGLGRDALTWVSGYTAGLAVRDGAAAPAPEAQSEAALTVLYGSQTGNARRWAERLADAAKAQGQAVTLTATGEYRMRALAQERCLLMVISTQGDGEPPDDALDFMEFVSSKRAPKLPQLQYAVLALGDSSYPAFCHTGKNLDERLAQLGARRLITRGECDLDIDSVAEPWARDALAHVREALQDSIDVRPSATVTPLRPATRFDREHPARATVLANQRLTTEDTDKAIYHIELGLDAGGPAFEPGDSLGVLHRNPSAMVDAVLAALGIDGGIGVTLAGEDKTLAQALSLDREIARVTRPFLEKHAARCQSQQLAALLTGDQRRACADFLKSRQLIELLRQWPADWEAQAFVEALAPLQTRLYSIASSATAIRDEIHLTVSQVAYFADGFDHAGPASTYLAGLDDQDDLSIYVEPNNRFRLPRELDRDCIMVGPGTGVAPFRAFVQEREATGARGRNWLFFGARHARTQFLYQTEWQRALKQGALKRLEPAFSRDQDARIYVQHRLGDCGREVYDWLEGGAHFYVCGGIEMEKDVRQTLKGIIGKHGGVSEEAASAQLRELERNGRYCRDVY